MPKQKTHKKSDDLDQKVKMAIKHFWNSRETKSVQAGETLDEFSALIKSQLIDCGIPEDSIFRKGKDQLPGFFRPTKKWDLVVVLEGQLFAALELKSQVGSFGNNYNNRTEEAIGSATDIWAAYREGTFKLSQRPWLGYMILLEEAPGSTRDISVTEPHFKIRDEFRGADYEKRNKGVSYAKRYELLCRKIVREGLYDAACFLLSDKESGKKGTYKEPVPDLSFRNFITPLIGRAIAYLMLKERTPKSKQ